MLDRAKLYGELDREFGRQSGMIAFTDRVVDYCENWARNKNVTLMNPTEVHDTLKPLIMQEEISYRSRGLLSLIPNWLWMWLLGKLISYIIMWWLDHRS